jgi:hypothetical protein
MNLCQVGLLSFTLVTSSLAIRLHLATEPLSSGVVATLPSSRPHISLVRWCGSTPWLEWLDGGKMSNSVRGAVSCPR